jgi:hypothetical protein
MDRRRLSVCAKFVGYTDAMGHINQSNVSIELTDYREYQYTKCETKKWILLDDRMYEK